ncbi:hypothetical protein AB7M17_001970 [Bradyrhizobium sp. USDA 377]
MTVANAGGGARKKATTNAKYVAASQKGAKQSLTIDMSWWAGEDVRIARRLPPTESFRLIKAPCRFFPTGDIDCTPAACANQHATLISGRKHAGVSAP